MNNKVNNNNNKSDLGVNKRRLNQLSPESIENRQTKLYKTTEMNSQEKVGDLTWGQFMSALTQTVRNEISCLATKEDLKTISSEIAELKEQHGRLEASVQELTIRENILQNKVDQLDRKAKEKNLIFKGLEVPRNENPEDSVKKNCSDVLGITDPLQIQRAFKIGPKETPVPPILVELGDYKESVKILRASNKLRGTKVFIERDYPTNMRRKRRLILKIKKSLNTLDRSVRITIRDDRMMINGEIFNVDGGKLYREEQMP